jgi:outer membrane protein assembly factor BamE (lipoprotein component of BamABCDE complex)
MSGCLISSAKSSKISGAYVAPGAVSSVVLNETTRTEVEQILGQPSTRTTNDDGTETWSWSWTKTKGDGGTVFLLFAGASKETIDQTVRIKFRDGIAIRKWRD